MAAEPSPLRIVTSEFPPYEYLKGKKPAGLNVEIIDRIMKRLNKPYRIDFYPWPRAWMMIRQKRADAIFSVSYHPERDDVLIYSDAQRLFQTTGKIPADNLWVSDYTFFIQQKHAKSYRFDSFEQVKSKGLKVGINKSYSYHPSFWQHQLEISSKVTLVDSVQALLQGEIDTWITDRQVGHAVAASLGKQDQLQANQKTFFRKPYYLLFSKLSDYPDLADLNKQFYAELTKMRESGELATLRRAYLPGEPAGPAKRKLLFVCERWEPFEYLKNGKVVGIDAEVVRRLMRRLNLPYEIKIYPWTRAWMMARAGKADAVLSISYKASREPILHYTEDQREFSQSGTLPENYLWMSEYVFFVKKKNLNRFKFDSYAQLAATGVKVGVNKDYSYDEAFRSSNLGSHTYFSTKDGMTGLVKDEIDLYPMDKTVGLAVLAEMGLGDSITYLEKPLFRKPYLAPFCRKSNYPELQAIMAKFYTELKQMRESGEYDTIVKNSQVDPKQLKAQE